MFSWLKRLTEKWKPVPASVEFNDTEVISHRASGKDEVVSWHELDAVSVVTTDTGPWVEDVYLVLQGCVVPQEAVGFDALLKRLQELPGFDNRAFCDAMSCTENATFPLWRRVEGQV